MSESAATERTQPAATPTTGLKNVVVKNVLIWFGAFITIFVLGQLSVTTGHLLLLGSLGASCVLLFGFPDVPFAQPRNVIGGHLLTVLVALAFLHLLGPAPVVLAAAVATGVVVMMLTGTAHPPAGSNPLIVFMLTPGWDFLLAPTLLSALAIVLFAWLYNNLVRGIAYPKSWT